MKTTKTKKIPNYVATLDDLACCVFENEIDAAIEQKRPANFLTMNLVRMLDYHVNETSRAGVPAYDFTTRDWWRAKRPVPQIAAIERARRHPRVLAVYAREKKREHERRMRERAQQKTTTAETLKAEIEAVMKRHGFRLDDDMGGERYELDRGTTRIVVSHVEGNPIEFWSTKDIHVLVSTLDNATIASFHVGTMAKAVESIAWLAPLCKCSEPTTTIERDARNAPCSFCGGFIPADDARPRRDRTRDLTVCEVDGHELNVDADECVTCHRRFGSGHCDVPALKTCGNTTGTHCCYCARPANETIRARDMATRLTHEQCKASPDGHDFGPQGKWLSCRTCGAENES